MGIDINQLEMIKVSVQEMKALQIISSDEPDLVELEQVILQDPLLASTVIRYANSPLYRRTAEISNVHTAIQLLGIRCIRGAIVSATIHSALSTENTVGQRILSHMLDISALCKLIARKCCQKAADDLEFLGLFHDIGMLILAENFPEQYVQLLDQASSESKPVDALEKEVFGISHDQVTVRASHDFRLPQQYQDLLKEFHSRPLLTEIEIESDQYVAILSLAHYLLISVKQNEDCFYETLGESLESLKELLVISPEQWVGLVEEANALFFSTGD
ncbi:MAG: HDOD domain-containing protein [Gammaproteobacteria bacterium]|nr:HDOD domain-containing protein [Gammaproteobacteria bacterium]